MFEQRHEKIFFFTIKFENTSATSWNVLSNTYLKTICHCYFKFKDRFSHNNTLLLCSIVCILILYKAWIFELEIAAKQQCCKLHNHQFHAMSFISNICLFRFSSSDYYWKETYDFFENMVKRFLKHSKIRQKFLFWKL